jgi:hypothetical protein
MNRMIILAVLTVIASTCCMTGCKEQLQADPPSLEGDELVIAKALRRHMYNHHERFGYDYQYIYVTVLGSDPGRDFIDYFSDFFSQVLPGSRMKESRYGYENLPETKGVWVRFEVVDFESVSEQEAWVTCQAFEYKREDPAVKYRMLLQDEHWKATDIIGIQSEKILQ